MYEILFYKDKKGREPVLDYLKELKARESKENRIKLKKIHEYIQLLSEGGLSIGEPYIKHLEGHIWELRPLRNRILFVVCENNRFVLLHSFMKQTQKTPRTEIEKAVREYNDLIERSKKQ